MQNTGTSYLITHITTSLRLICILTGIAALTAIPVCCESGSTHLGQYNAADIRFSLTIFKESNGNAFLWLADITHPHARTRAHTHTPNLTNMLLIALQSFVCLKKLTESTDKNRNVPVLNLQQHNFIGEVNFV